MERADQVLARVGVDPGLAADGRVDHAEQRGRARARCRHAAQPGGRGEAGDVGGGAAAEADDRVLAADTDAAQHFPDEPDDRQVLAGLGVGDLDAMRVDALVGQVSCGSPRRSAPAPAGAGSRPCACRRGSCAKLAQQAGADDHRVRRVDGHLDGDGRASSVIAGLGATGQRRRAGGRAVARTGSVSATTGVRSPRRATPPPRSGAGLLSAGSPAATRCGAPRPRDCGGWC